MTSAIIHDTAIGFFPTVAETFDRFMASADDAGVERDFAASVFADALRGEACSRALVESTCGIEFL